MMGGLLGGARNRARCGHPASKLHSPFQIRWYAYLEWWMPGMLRGVRVRPVHTGRACAIGGRAPVRAPRGPLLLQAAQDNPVKPCIYTWRPMIPNEAI